MQGWHFGLIAAIVVGLIVGRMYGGSIPLLSTLSSG
jgi:hypothetical protein